MMVVMVVGVAMTIPSMQGDLKQVEKIESTDNDKTLPNESTFLLFAEL